MDDWRKRYNAVVQAAHEAALRTVEGERARQARNNATLVKMRAERLAREGRLTKAVSAFAKAQSRFYTGKKTIGLKGQKAWNAGTRTARAKQWTP